jgi:proliferating cell nuclear antigen
MSTDSKTHHNDDTAAPNDTTNAPDDTSDSAPAAFTASINVGYVQRFLDAIRRLDDKCRLHISPSGVATSVRGPGGAMMAEARLDASAFDAYDTDGDDGVIGVSVQRLREITRMTSNSAVMAFELGDSETLRVRAGALDCSLELSDPHTIRSTDGFEDDELPSVVVLEGGELKRIVKAAGHVDDMVDLRTENSDERFIVTADNGDDSFRAPRPAESLEELFVGEAEVEARYNLTYLKDAKKAVHKRTEVTLALGSDLPLSLGFGIADGAGHVEYGIAPVVEAD